jgi:hypothetical protein
MPLSRGSGCWDWTAGLLRWSAGLTPTELPGITDPPILFSPESAAIAAEAVPSKRAAARAILVLFNISNLHRWIVGQIVAVFNAGFFNDGAEINASTNFENKLRIAGLRIAGY